MVSPSKPDERSVRRGPCGVVINAAVPAIELHDGEVCVRRSGSREAERQCANCKEDFFMPIAPVLRPSAAAQSLAGVVQALVIVQGGS